MAGENLRSRLLLAAAALENHNLCGDACVEAAEALDGISDPAAFMAWVARLEEAAKAIASEHTSPSPDAILKRVWLDRLVAVLKEKP